LIVKCRMGVVLELMLNLLCVLFVLGKIFELPYETFVPCFLCFEVIKYF